MTTVLPVRPVVDVDDPATWPAPLATLAEELAALAPADDPDYAYEDLPIEDREDEARQLLTGYLVRARHCTRLLDHEANAIRSEGLRLLTPELIADKLDQAHRLGFLTAAEFNTLTAENSLSSGGQKYGKRDNQVCLVLSTSVLAHEPNAVRLLLSYWGGEGIYWRHCENKANPALAAKLGSLGRPAIVTALLDLSDPQQPHRIYRSLVHAFVGRELDDPTAGADVFYRAHVPAERIESIVHPGDEMYDRFPRLPRS